MSASVSVSRAEDQVTADAVEVVIEALVRAQDRQSRALVLTAVVQAMCDTTAWLHEPHVAPDEVIALMELAALAESHQLAVSRVHLEPVRALHPVPTPVADDAGTSEVVARAQQGDTLAFERLVHAYEGELGRLAQRMLRDHGEAEDVVQDVFVQAWRRLDRLDDPEAFHGWLYQITTRACLNALRARSRRRSDLTDGTDSSFDESAPGLEARRGDGPQAVTQNAANLHDLGVVLTGLPANLRACWVLKQLHGLSYADIAYVTGVPASTVRGRLVRARRAVRLQMTAWR